MAEGGEFGMDQPDLDHDIDHDDDDDDDDDEQEVNTTRPFQPGTASTPYHGGEQHEMQTMHHEQSGLPETSFDEAPLLERTHSISDLHNESALRQKMKKAVDMIKGKFSRANWEKMKIRRGTGKILGKIVAVGSKGGEYKILKDDDSDFMKSFLDAFKKDLGPRTEENISQDNQEIRENWQRLREAEKQLIDAEKLASEREKAAQEVQNLRNRIERNQAQIDAHTQEHGTTIESESELRRLQQLKKNLQHDFENAK